VWKRPPTAALHRLGSQHLPLVCALGSGVARGAARHTRVVCPGRSSTMVCRRRLFIMEHVATPAQEGAVETTMTVAASVCSAVATLFTSQRGSAHQGKFMPFHPLGTRHGALAPTSLQVTHDCPSCSLHAKTLFACASPHSSAPLGVKAWAYVLLLGRNRFTCPFCIEKRPRHVWPIALLRCCTPHTHATAPLWNFHLVRFEGFFF
jgi:hypothetical protein